MAHELVDQAQQPPLVEGRRKLVYYIAPTIDMAKNLMWKELKTVVPPSRVAYKNETAMEMILKGFDATIHCRGAANPDTLRGIDPDFVAFDEMQDIDIDVWNLIISPALASKGGDALFAGTPKGTQNGLYELAMRGKDPTFPDWFFYHITSGDSGNIKQEELDRRRRELSPRHYRQEFHATFEAPEGQIYSNFDRDLTVRDDLKDNGSPILVGLDFNVDPMSAVIAVRSGAQIHVIDEIVLMNSNTEEVCQEISARYPNRRVRVFPDPSGQARRTSAGGNTDFTIIKDYGFTVIAPAKAPLVRDRINTVQAALLTADGSRRFFVHPRCKQLIKAFEGLTYQPGTSVPDKSSGLDHCLDAAGYLTMHEMPIRKQFVGSIRAGGS